MKLYVLLILSLLHLSNAERLNPRHLHLNRQLPTSTHQSLSSSSSPTVSNPSSTPAAQNPTPSAPTTSLPVASTPSGNSTVVSATITTATGPPRLDTGTGVPPLANITSGMATQAPLPVSTTYHPGASPPIQEAPVLPSPLVLGAWPPQDKIPDTSSPEVQTWLKELDGFNIPSIPPTIGGSCATDPVAAANAATNGWWTCGGYTRDTDITACPDHLTWGVSFDDGPAAYTQKLLNYLDQKNISATFFVVGSRVLERPAVLIEEYMSGHEISVHTWSHPPLTTLTNEQIVAELGWTRKAIKDVIGLTALTFRPPYGDIDDRVRAIALAMGMIPMLWSKTPTGAKFDTNDWMVASGAMTGNQSVNSFSQILTNATGLDTGFIVLEHDLFEITVDLAVGYTLDMAMNFQPKLDLKPIGECTRLFDNIYLETNTNTSFPYRNQTAGGDGIDVDGNGTKTTSGSGSGSGSTSAGFVATIPVLSSLAFGAIAALSILL